MRRKDFRLQSEAKPETLVSCREQRERAEILRLRSQIVGNKRVIREGGDSLGAVIRERTKPDTQACKVKEK